MTAYLLGATQAGDGASGLCGVRARGQCLTWWQGHGKRPAIFTVLVPSALSLALSQPAACL